MTLCGIGGTNKYINPLSLVAVRIAIHLLTRHIHVDGAVRMTTWLSAVLRTIANSWNLWPFQMSERQSQKTGKVSATARKTYDKGDRMNEELPLVTYRPKHLSGKSDPTVPNSLFFGADIQLAASVIIIQPSTGLVVLLSVKDKYFDKHNNIRERDFWFLPKGRKDVGESLEETALREGYEEVSDKSSSSSY